MAWVTNGGRCFADIVSSRQREARTIKSHRARSCDGKARQGPACCQGYGTIKGTGSSSQTLFYSGEQRIDSLFCVLQSVDFPTVSALYLHASLCT